jgi:D-sedoheptulose 7-phosphate isomerase
MKNIKNYFTNFADSLISIDYFKIEKISKILNQVRRKKGRIFFLGVGGSAGNATHAVNDFRKICNIECYTPTDNVSELTARINDEGWDTSFKNWLITSNLNSKDAIFIFSVGGGNLKKKISVNLIESIKLAKKTKSKILGIVGKKDGYAYQNGDAVLSINVKESKYLTPISEAMQAVVWHCLVSQPILQKNKTKW